MLDSTGFGTDAQVICGLDYVAALAQSQPGPYVVNMSLGDPNRPGETTCGSSALHQAICDLTNAGVTVVAAAGNDGTDAAGFVPAAYDEVIAVSAFTDFDGQRSFAGCQSDFSDYGYQCDDTLADFSNYGSVVDVTAPGVHVLSDWIDGGLTTISGTSMAAPHVAGAAALVLGANPSLTPAQVRGLLESTGECPDGAVANAPTCAGHGQWQVGGLFGRHPTRTASPSHSQRAARRPQARRNPAAAASASSAARRHPAADGWVHRTGHGRDGPRHGQRVGERERQRRRRARRLLRRPHAHRQRLHRSVLRVVDHERRRPAHAHRDRVRHRRAHQQRHAAPSPSTTRRRRRGHQPGGGTVSGTFTITADSSDPAPGSGVASVQFLVDGTVVATDTTAPYSTTWNTATTRTARTDRRPRHRRSRERHDVSRGAGDGQQRVPAVVSPSPGSPAAGRSASSRGPRGST